jgi:hypothetical protein
MQIRSSGQGRPAGIIMAAVIEIRVTKTPKDIYIQCGSKNTAETWYNKVITLRIKVNYSKAFVATLQGGSKPTKLTTNYDPKC